jgi:hypothetical protein
MAIKTSKFKWPTSSQAISLAGFAIGVVGLLAKLINRDFPTWITILSVFGILVCVLYLTRQWLSRLLRLIHPHLERATPWLVALLIVQSGLILFHVWPVTNRIQVSFDSSKAAVYNSWQHQNHHTKYIEARGAGDTLDWVIIDKGRTGNFRFKVNSDQEPSKGASSGGYISFYDRMCDRLRYRTLRFHCRVTDATGNPDLGVRLSVDNPKTTGDRELISYEIKSLSKFVSISDEWRSVDIPLSAFQQVRYEPPFPEGLDENTINKIVFFVDNDIAQKCKQATFWFSEIDFRP